MKTLIDFIEASGAALPGPSTKAAVAGELRSFEVPEGSAEEFAAKTVEIISDAAFVQDLSARIGEPKPHETKQEFINRAKAHAAKLLEKRLK